jgi:hypothetical protein
MSPRKRSREHWLHRWKRPWSKTHESRGSALLTTGGRYVPAPPWALPEGLVLMHDPTPARWIEDSAPKYDWATVGAIMPEGFDAYARVLHPAYRRTGPYEQEPVSWAEVAAMTGRAIHPLAQFAKIAGIEDLNGRPEWGERPDEGDLPREVALPLQRILGSFTEHADGCWFCMWVGWGDLDLLEGYDEDSYPHVKMPGREYLLVHGPLTMLTEVGANGGNDPSIWWPDDRAWCVATEIDLDSTYVGGSAECIAALMADPALETFPAALHDRVDFGSDTIND